MIKRAQPIIYPEGGTNGSKDQICRLIVHPTAGGKIRGSHNCGNCDKHVVAAIERYAVSGDLNEFNGIVCDCESVWREELTLESALPLPLGISSARRGNPLNNLRSL